MLVKEKVDQAIKILDEYDIDCWITFVRESGMMRDPMMAYLCPADMTWHSAFIVTRSGDTHAIVGQMEKQTVEELEVWGQVTGYVEGIKGELQSYLKALGPASIAVNFSRNSEVCDGLTHGTPTEVKGQSYTGTWAFDLTSRMKNNSSFCPLGRKVF